MSKTTYASAGINLDRYNSAIDRLLGMIQSTQGRSVINLPDGFAGLFSLRNQGPFRDPVLVSCTDGVGTKILVAQKAGKHTTLGIDLVAMSVNDLIVTGATPLFFLDYVVTGTLKERMLLDIMRGIVDGCRQSGCALLGGETAEHPGQFKPGEYDLAGFAVGIVERSRIIDGSKIRVGDEIIGLPSSGLHSNGFTLVRKILFDKHRMRIRTKVKELRSTLDKVLLKPTRIYADAVRRILATPATRRGVHGLAHVSGGGLVENLPRILPKRCAAEIREGSWKIPPIFPYLQKKGSVPKDEMFRVFNMGIGMAVIVAPAASAAVQRALKKAGESPKVIGRIVKGPQEVRLISRPN